MDVFFLNDVDHISYFVKMPIFPNGRFFLVDHYTVDLFSISGLFFRGRFFRGPYFLNSCLLLCCSSNLEPYTYRH